MQMRSNSRERKFMRKHIMLFITVFCGFTVIVAADLIDQAQLPEWQPGFYWGYFNAQRDETLEYWVLGTRAIRGLDHYVLAQKNHRDGALSINLAFAPVRAPFPRRTNTPASQTYLDFPLEQGLLWTVREAASAGFLNTTEIQAQLFVFEKVETGFGAFDSFRIDYEREGQTWSLWYAPHAQSWVKQTNPVDGSAFVLQETWQFTGAYALKELFALIESQLEIDPKGMRRLLNDLIKFEFDIPRAEALKTKL